MSKFIKNIHLNKKNEKEIKYKVSYYDLLINSRPFRLEKNSSKLCSYHSLKEDKMFTKDIERVLSQRITKKFNDE